MLEGGSLDYEPGTLADISNRLQAAAKELGELASSAPMGVDAGTSSAVVGQALSALTTAAATASALMEADSGKVDAAHGSYDNTEDTNASSMNKVNQTFQNTNYGGPAYQYPG